MFICQLPQNAQDELKKDITNYYTEVLGMDYFKEIGESIEESINRVMCEKLQNILNLSDESENYGLTTKKYGKYL